MSAHAMRLNTSQREALERLYDVGPLRVGTGGHGTLNFSTVAALVRRQLAVTTMLRGVVSRCYLTKSGRSRVEDWRQIARQQPQ